MIGNLDTTVRRLQEVRPPLAHLALFYLAFLVVAGFGQWLALIPGITIILWPPNGLFIATLLLAARASWPWWIVLGAVAELTCNALWFQNPTHLALAYAATNALEATVAAWLLARFFPAPARLGTLGQVVALVGLGVVLAPTIAATIGSTIDAAIGKHAFTTAWVLWWIGDATGILITAPLTLVAVEAWREYPRRARPRIAEPVLLVTALLAVGAVALGGYLPFAYIMTPLLLWAAVRFEFRGAVATTALLALMVAVFTVTGVSPFAGDGASQSQLGRYVMMQLFMAISALTGLVVAAITRQYRGALKTLRAANDELEIRIADRTAKLRDSEARFRATFEYAAISIAVIDDKGSFVQANDSFARIIGYSEAELKTLTWQAITHPDDLAEGLAQRDRVRRGETETFRLEKRYLRKDGSVVWGHVTVGSVRDTWGAVEYFIAGMEDITDRRAAEEALRLSEARLAHSMRIAGIAAEAGGIASWHIDIASNRLEHPPEAHHLLGTKPGTVFDSPDALEAIVHPDDIEPRRRARARAFEGDSDRIDLEFRIRRSDGAVRWINSRGIIVRNAEGRPTESYGISIDITDRKESEERVRLLMREVNHRSKNMLGLVQAVARQTAASSPGEFVKRFSDRMQALASAQDLLVRNDWRGVALDALVRAQLAHFGDLIGTRILIEGPALLVTASAAQSIGLAIHELATNAGKYGALSNAAGRISLACSVAPDQSATERFTLAWTECDGPPVSPPERRGFGTTVIERMAAMALGANITLAYPPTGLVWRLACPLERIGRGVTSGTGFVVAAKPPQSGAPRVLVVEDEPLAALELKEVLEQAGFRVVGPAASVQHALRLVQTEGCDVAVLDINLGGETSEAVATCLASAHVPFVTVSGYLRNQQPDAFVMAPFVGKPIDPDALVREVRRCLTDPAPRPAAA